MTTFVGYEFLIFFSFMSINLQGDDGYKIYENIIENYHFLEAGQLLNIETR